MGRRRCSASRAAGRRAIGGNASPDDLPGYVAATGSVSVRRHPPAVSSTLSTRLSGIDTLPSFSIVPSGE